MPPRVNPFRRAQLNAELAERQFLAEREIRQPTRRVGVVERTPPPPPPATYVIVENPDGEIMVGKKEIPQLKKGGLVKKTGIALVHKGEVVIPASRVKAVEKAMKAAKLKPLKK